MSHDPWGKARGIHWMQAWTLWMREEAPYQQEIEP
jgi:hypothetical protein